MTHNSGIDVSPYGAIPVPILATPVIFSRDINFGEIIDYGVGWRLDQHRGHRRVAHGGTCVGFRTAIARFPDEKLAIVVLTIRTDGDPTSYVDKIRDNYLPDRVKKIGEE